MKPVRQSRNLFKGAFILTIAALITKLLSAIYRIPFQNIVGDVGFYIYQQAYPFYAIAVALATTGFPVVISKLYAEAEARRENEGEERLFVISFLFLQFLGVVCFVILFAGAGKIAGWMHDSELAVLLKVISFIFLLFPPISLLRGYFLGRGWMFPTAASQVSEQTIRVLTILILSFYLTKKGYSLYFVGGAAMLGSIIGSIFSFLVLLFFFTDRKKWAKALFNRQPIRFIGKDSGWIIKALVFQGLAICLSGMLMIFLQIADSLSLYSELVSSGVGKEAAKSLKGIYDRGQPLIQLGTVAATSMSLSLVPLIASERLKKKPAFLEHTIRLSMQISLVLGVGASAGLWSIMEPANTMLFENDFGSDVMRVLGLVILFNSGISTMTAIMQGMGSLLFPAVMIVLSFPLKYSMNLFLIPVFGTMGAALSSVFTLAIISLFLTVKLKKELPFSFYTGKFWVITILAALSIMVFLKGYLWMMSNWIMEGAGANRIGAALLSLSAVFLGGAVFLTVVLRGKVFSEEDLSLFPFGSKLTIFLPNRNRSRNNGKEN
ncbi:putative polysaccharide biosynthesis protein [Neobacillus sp. SM06]|uniref:putative polysaccharide biosynthesis protein n=1 Tax=Neobacillus sp. SM06 TaxID=3422492 RepID=UPI003D29B3FB